VSLNLSNKKTDKDGYNEFYKDQISDIFTLCNNPTGYMEVFKKSGLVPFCHGGNTKGYVRGLAVQKLISSSNELSVPRNEITILDAGCGLGELSVYLACQGFNVIGVDISEEACLSARELSKRMGVPHKCQFLAESLEKLPIAGSSIDFVIGHASLHHFIKYDVPTEFHRVMKPHAKGFFADSFGENPIYSVFHDKEKMERLGDVVLTKKRIESYFTNFKVRLTPTDWFSMLDKLYLKFVPKRFQRYVCNTSKIHFWLDRRLPISSRAMLFLSGSVMTEIEKIKASSVNE